MKFEKIKQLIGNKHSISKIKKAINSLTEKDFKQSLKKKQSLVDCLRFKLGEPKELGFEAEEHSDE